MEEQPGVYTGKNVRIIDGHIHFSSDLDSDRLTCVIDSAGYSAVALLCIPKGFSVQTEMDAFRAKQEIESKLPNFRVFVFGGMLFESYEKGRDSLSEMLVRRIHELHDLGCTGIKLIEGKPNVRKMYPIPDFDSPVWEPFWDDAEKLQIPVVMHVNDPEEFWDSDSYGTEEERKFRVESGWAYDESYVNNENQYRQIGIVLEKHPYLKVLFPHFFFLSKQLDRLADLLNRFPNVMIDLTPGVELYFNLSENPVETKIFFERFQDRICFGTDIGSRQVICSEPKSLNIQESNARIRLVERFLTSQSEYVLSPDAYYKGTERVIRPPRLSPHIISKIYCDNFCRFAGVSLK